jgi:hypothetical protein
MKYIVRVFQFCMKRDAFILFPLFVLYLSGLTGCAGVPAAETEAPVPVPVTLEGSMSTVCLALVERQNRIRNEDRAYNHPDGLAFYFVIYPSGENYAVVKEKEASALIPTIKEAQQFTINGTPYWQNLNGSIDSQTVIFNAKTFKQNEPETATKLNLADNTGMFIQKTVICGEPLPAEGIVRYPFYFGFEQELEEFDFLFKLQDVL